MFEVWHTTTLTSKLSCDNVAKSSSKPLSHKAIGSRTGGESCREDTDVTFNQVAKMGGV